MKQPSTILYHSRIGSVKVSEATYRIQDKEVKTKNAKLVVDVLLGLGFRRLL